MYRRFTFIAWILSLGVLSSYGAAHQRQYTQEQLIALRTGLPAMEILAGREDPAGDLALADEAKKKVKSTKAGEARIRLEEVHSKLGRQTSLLDCIADIEEALGETDSRPLAEKLRTLLGDLGAYANVHQMIQVFKERLGGEGTVEARLMKILVMIGDKDHVIPELKGLDGVIIPELAYAIQLLGFGPDIHGTIQKALDCIGGDEPTIFQNIKWVKQCIGGAGTLAQRIGKVYKLLPGEGTVEEGILQIKANLADVTSQHERTRGDLQQILIQHQQQMTALRDDLAQQKAAYALCVKEKEAQHEDLLLAQGTLKEKEEALDKAVASHTALKTRYEAQKAEQEKLIAELAQIQAEMKVLKKKTVLHEKHITEKEQRIKVLTDTHSQKATELSALQAKYKDKTAAHDALMVQLQTLTADYRQSAEDRDRLEKEKESLTASQESLETERDKLAERLVSLTATLKIAQSTIDTQAAEIEALKTDQGALFNEVKTLQAKIKTQDSHLKGLEVAHKKVLSNVEVLEAKLKKKSAAFELITQEMAVLQKTHDTLSAKSKKLEETHADLETRHQKEKMDHAEVIAIAKEAKADVERMADHLETLQQQYDVAEKAAARLQEEKNRLSTDYEVLEKSHQRISAKLSTTETKHIAQEEQLREAKKELESITDEKEKLAAEINALSTKLEEDKKHLKALEGKNTAQAAEIELLTTERVAVEERLLTLAKEKEAVLQALNRALTAQEEIDADYKVLTEELAALSKEAKDARAQLGVTFSGLRPLNEKLGTPTISAAAQCYAGLVGVDEGVAPAGDQVFGHIIDLLQGANLKKADLRGVGNLTELRDYLLERGNRKIAARIEKELGRSGGEKPKRSGSGSGDDD